MLKISEIQSKDIVNISDGKVLGHIGDLDINLDEGTVKSIIIGGTGRMLTFLGGKEAEIVIPWENIVKIGSDVILVRLGD
ncbi:YlmC/YmxH family sporulation protein [Anaerobacillus sp. CMMVII]|uniref:YlmC/YmxH family sporulation protein n=1 Tax=Anaerobacillus sp. CMMVII TaxID=2755588 RepID=UPI0021B738BA|nr:YlmC/YmxH family sporulation protein [Anaerobacillus sp. CMMVII]MCT8139747.1 YlmC/YmxH family sporulation protein [Anaerobacillus sp. CMMVII]